MEERKTGLRIDKWLWFVRLAKTRSLAQKLIDEGTVVVNGRRIERASGEVRPGDLVLFPYGRGERLVRVKKLEVKRVGAALAQSCYEDADLDDLPR